HGSHIEKLDLSTKEKTKPTTNSGLFDRRKKTIPGTEKYRCIKSQSKLKLGSVLKKLWRTSGNSNTKHGKKDTKRRKIPINDIVTHS
ncbi:hypothetical protein LI213_17025, partial [Erysipelatoclostridium ramosum]|nr:hypothetical protein [Thomasclavelia ramosa]